MKKKILAVSMATLMALSIVGCSPKAADPVTPTTPVAETPVAETPTEPAKVEIAKPEKIVAFMDTAFGSMLEAKTWANFNAKFQEMTGIPLEMTKPDHQQYYEQMNLAFTSGNIPDIIEIGTTYYPTYAANGALWDMTAAWENSELRAKGIVTEKYVDALKIDGKLYGFPFAKGNGTITYVRKDWLDNLGLAVPTTYEEFMNVLKAFTFNDPDGNGKNDTYGITAAGLINTETPYTIYLREFYQDANPDFYLKDGAYVDGMAEPLMVEALQRMKDAYAAGVVDKEIVTNKTSTSRDKFYAGEVGVFNYWAGTWNATLENNTKATNPDASVVPIPPIAETFYIERPPISMSITSAATNPEGIFKYMVEFAHDGAEGQLLFTRGIEGENYVKGDDGKYTQLPDPENPDKKFEKTYFAPELNYVPAFQDPIEFDQRVVDSLKMFEDNSVIASVPMSSEVISANLPELVVIRGQAIAKAVTTNMSVADAIAEYQANGKMYIDAILADLNK